MEEAPKMDEWKQGRKGRKGEILKVSLFRKF
jgi:hypothetical protein